MTDTAAEIASYWHFKKGNGACLCRTFTMRNRLLLTPEPLAVTCPKCRQLLQQRNKVKPIRSRS